MRNCHSSSNCHTPTTKPSLLPPSSRKRKLDVPAKKRSASRCTASVFPIINSALRNAPATDAPTTTTTPIASTTPKKPSSRKPSRQASKTRARDATARKASAKKSTASASMPEFPAGCPASARTAPTAHAPTTK